MFHAAAGCRVLNSPHLVRYTNSSIYYLGTYIESFTIRLRNILKKYPVIAI